MELCCDAMLCTNLGRENVDAGHIKCPRGPQVPHPWLSDYVLQIMKVLRVFLGQNLNRLLFLSAQHSSLTIRDILRRGAKKSFREGFETLHVVHILIRRSLNLEPFPPKFDAFRTKSVTLKCQTMPLK